MASYLDVGLGIMDSFIQAFQAFQAILLAS